VTPDFPLALGTVCSTVLLYSTCIINVIRYTAQVPCRYYAALIKIATVLYYIIISALYVLLYPCCAVGRDDLAPCGIRVFGFISHGFKIDKY
jgi:hypothetical protein